jgi:hypothetical protein
MENNTAKNKTSDSGRAGLIGLGALLLLSIIGNIYLYNNRAKMQTGYKEDIDSLVTVRVMLQNEFNNTTAELNKYKGLSTELDALLTDANATISEKEELIKKMMKERNISSSTIARLNKELAELRMMKEGYMDRIDSLLTINVALKEQNIALSAEKENLSRKVEDASALRTEYVVVTTSKKKGNDKFTPTSMAKKTNKIDVCFSVLDNKLAAPGERKLNLKIISPSNSVVGGNAENATFQNKTTGLESPFTAEKMINFGGEKQDICMDFVSDERKLESGTYIIQIFLDGVLTSNTNYTLR